ncbi:MAG: DNA-directed RNA polymerase subunit beta [Elusimicrobia bacterium]|nr:DNA-directed RNA polymerase subunit beta [Elusimicrobiota bacterium]
MKQIKFGRIPQAMELPDLLEMQKKSFRDFLQLGAEPDARKLMGLQASFLDVFPIESSDGSMVLDFVRYEFAPPRYESPEEAQAHDASWSRPLKAILRLSSRQPSGRLKQIMEQEVVLCEVPMMTDTASFIINGAERVVVSQLHRSPGIIFEEDEEKKISSLGKRLFFAKIIPYRGAWVEFEFDLNNILYVRIDRKKKFEATTFLRACGIETDSDILKIFYPYEEVAVSAQTMVGLLHRIVVEDIVDQASGEVLHEAGKKITHEAIKRMLDKGVQSVKLLTGDPEKDDPTILETLRKDKVKSVKEAQQDIYKKLRGQEFIVPGQAEAYLDNLIFKNLRKYDLSNVGRRKIHGKLHHFLWKLAVRRDIVCRPDNRRHKYFALPAYNRRSLCVEDIIATMQYVIALNTGVSHYADGQPRTTPMPIRPAPYEALSDLKSLLQAYAKAVNKEPLETFPVIDLHEKDSDDDPDAAKQGLKKDRISFLELSEAINRWRENVPTFFDRHFAVKLDDIDHLGNRRVRGVGELLENQIRVGLAQMSRVIRDRMSVQDKSTLTPRNLLNTAPMVGILRKFFGTSQLSQFMDQINPLSEITHKRRLSALGPGGLNRKRAGFEVRDVHHTHYGRICPIETPEGPNIGLITSLATYARINEFGLIESPYRKVQKGKLTGEVLYLGADEESGQMVAQANTPLEKDRLAIDLAACRSRGDFPLVEPARVDYMDISPMQVVSVSAALIPFLEHDDANRALMGCNMQRQAVPLLSAEPSLVITGIEDAVAKDSGACVTAKRAGQVIYSAGDLIAVHADDAKSESGAIDLYSLRKYRRSNQDTCINQTPAVKTGDAVKAGEVLADGPGTSRGQLALGRNLLVGFMPWEGYNFEDAILISERLVKDDVFTSIHITEFEVEARDTKLGAEEITRDIPNVGAEALEALDEQGIVIPSTNVAQGDVLVGKVTPKGEQQLTPEERLLKVIFGKKAEDVQDASLRVPPGISGKVIGVRVFVRREKLSKPEERKRLDVVTERLEKALASLRQHRKDSLAALEELPAAKRRAEEERLTMFYKIMEKKMRDDAAREKENVRQGDELAVTVNKVVKVYIASRRKVQVGDKLAGRHGNKGVVAKVLPEEDMPFLPDGTPLDVVLSPLGVPSRMNIGQLLEMMLGWAAHVTDTQMVNPVFDSATEKDIIEMVHQAKKTLKENGVPDKYLPSDDCRITLYDGRTGEPFQEKVSVGYMYMLKLNHLVEDKVHARSTGPYSLITRQPLGGKAQFGGQRFGEMEVWAIEGYGAAYALQEFLTVKSDDVAGRTKMYEAIIKGEPPAQPGVPESFKVLVRELQALGLNVELLKLGEDGEAAAAKAKKDKSKEAVESTRKA